MISTTHTTTIHAQCPKGGWDYYKCEFRPDDFIEVEAFEQACDSVRGVQLYQEKVCEDLSALLPPGMLTLTGQHGSNTGTVSRTFIVEDQK